MQTKQTNWPTSTCPPTQECTDTQPQSLHKLNTYISNMLNNKRFITHGHKELSNCCSQMVTSKKLNIWQQTLPTIFTWLPEANGNCQRCTTLPFTSGRKKQAGRQGAKRGRRVQCVGQQIESTGRKNYQADKRKHTFLQVLNLFQSQACSLTVAITNNNN